MNDTKPTLTDVATYFEDPTGRTASEVVTCRHMAATVRLADDLLGRCVSALEYHGSHAELIADIRKIRGGGQ